MQIPHWRRPAAVVLALAMTLSLGVTSTLAYGTDSWNSWVSRSASTTFKFNIPVCLAANFQPAGGGDWDLSINRIKRIHDAIVEWNSNDIDGHYYESDRECTPMRDDRTPHLEVGWGVISLGLLAQTTGNNDAVCVDRCRWMARIEFQDEDHLLYDGHWYKGDSPSVPCCTSYDLMGVMLHELGHASGLRHSRAPSSVMCSADSVEPGYPCAHDYDVLGPGDAHRYYYLDDILGFEDLWGNH